MNKITILGSGTSTGVPILGCKCQVCQSNEIRNKRLRTSAILQTTSGKMILIDASPDLRTQLLGAQVDRLDGIIITHDHADHTHGMDDLRPFGFINKTPLPVFTNEYTSISLKEKFPYIFQREKIFADKVILGGGIPLLDLHLIAPGQSNIMDEDLEFFSLPHGHIETLGVRHGKMAYLVDCQSVPEETLRKLRADQLDLLVIDCLRPLPHQTHLHFDLTMEYIESIQPRLAVLTHLGHEWDYLELTQKIQGRGMKNVIVAIDEQSFLYSSK